MLSNIHLNVSIRKGELICYPLFVSIPCIFTVPIPIRLGVVSPIVIENVLFYSHRFYHCQ